MSIINKYEKPFLSNNEMIILKKMIVRLFAYWKIDRESQQILLGYNPKSCMLWSDCFQESLDMMPADIIDRIGLLLTIHRALRSLYPKNTELCYQWVTLENVCFQKYSPLDYMKNYGLIGIKNVALYLQAQLVL